jgi:hypothetical protein
MDSSSAARSLATLTALGRQSADAQGQAAGSAAAGTFGIMIAQLYLSGQTSTGARAMIFFDNMRVFLGSADNRLIVGFPMGMCVPAPGALALIGIARPAGGRRRLA